MKKMELEYRFVYNIHILFVIHFLSAVDDVASTAVWTLNIGIIEQIGRKYDFFIGEFRVYVKLLTSI